jgi:hypothetical protein
VGQTLKTRIKTMRAIGAAVAFVCFSLGAAAQLSRDVRDYVKLDAPVIAITHARVIDGTGASARTDQTIIIRQGKIDP